MNPDKYALEAPIASLLVFILIVLLSSQHETGS